jgi:transcriptional regulator with XRE-family HTH domain
LDFSRWLAERRRQGGLTQRELARKCMVTPAYVAHIESGTSEAPPLQTCKSLARALGLDWKEVWQRSFAVRLKRWLKQQGHFGIPDDELTAIVNKILSSGR